MTEVAAMDDDQWITKRQRHPRRHNCAQVAPEVVPTDAYIWRCPQCRRRWKVLHNNGPARISEGEWFTNAKRDAFWRSFRCRFIGRLWF